MGESEASRPSRENPKQFLLRMQSKRVLVALKWGQSYEGSLVCSDNYFNVLLDECFEIDNGIRMRIGEVSIRCNNIKSITEM